MFYSLIALLPILASAAPLSAVSTRQYSAGFLLKSTRDGTCLSIPQGQEPSDGTPVVSIDCDSASKWAIEAGETQNIRIYGTKYALDIGLNPGNNGQMKVWTNYPGAPQQTWDYNDQNQLRNPNSGQCIDLGDNGLQTYQCYDGNTNQEWIQTIPGDIGGGGSDSVPSGFTYIKATNLPYPSSACLTVQDGFGTSGSRVDFSSCMIGSDGSLAALSAWLLPPKGTSGPIRTYDSSGYEDGIDSYNPSRGYLCLDAGNNPENASSLKVYTCYDGLLQQTWTVNDDGTISLADGQCLDVEKETIGNSDLSKPYPTRAEVQTWQCSDNGDPYQQFYFTTSRD